METILLSPSEEMTVKGWQEAKEAVEDRIRILAECIFLHILI